MLKINNILKVGGNQNEPYESRPMKRTLSHKENTYSNIHNKKIKPRKPSQEGTGTDVSQLDLKIESILNRNQQLSAQLEHSNPAVHHMLAKLIQDQGIQDTSVQRIRQSTHYEMEEPIDYSVMKERVLRLEQIIEEQSNDIQQWRDQHEEEVEQLNETIFNQQGYITFLTSDLETKNQQLEEGQTQLLQFKQQILKQSEQLLQQMNVIKEQQYREQELHRELARFKQEEQVPQLASIENKLIKEQIERLRSEFENFQLKQQLEQKQPERSISTNLCVQGQEVDLTQQSQLVQTMDKLKCFSDRLLKQTRS